MIHEDGVVQKVLDFQSSTRLYLPTRQCENTYSSCINANVIAIMEWPPNSPDINPIREHLWHCLKTQLHKRFPDTPLLGGGTVRQSLEERLIVVWENIVRERLDKLRPRRVHALYKAKGWYTPY
jgi:hypothetical protein